MNGEAHFINTILLTGPSGKIEGRVSRTRPSSLEASIYSYLNQSECSHIVQSSHGYRFGVLICYKNLLHDALVGLQSW